jgi:MFS family permease
MLGFTIAAMAVAYLDRICISTAAPSVKADLGLSDAQMGYVFSAFTLAYALFEVPSGWLADRFGARSVLTRIVLWWSAVTAATGGAWSSWETPLVTVAALYVFAALCWLGIDPEAVLDGDEGGFPRGAGRRAT